jgi:hypothetical protein
LKEDVLYRKQFVVLMLFVMAIGVAAFSQTVVVPRDYSSVLLFDNNTGATVQKLGVMFDRQIVATVEDVLVAGGEMATLVASSNQFLWIEAKVAPQGTLVLLLQDVDAEFVDAFWF